MEVGVVLDRLHVDGDDLQRGLKCGVAKRRRCTAERRERERTAVAR